MLAAVNAAAREREFAGLPRPEAARSAPMKISRVLLVSALVAGAFLPGSEAAPPKQSRRSRQPTGLSDPVGAGRVDAVLLARMRAAPLGTRARGRALQMHVVSSDPSLAALQAGAAAARTDEAKRAAWSEYNTRLYGEMRRRDPALRAHVDLLEKIARSRFEPPVRRGEAMDSLGYDRAET